MAKQVIRVKDYTCKRKYPETINACSSKSLTGVKVQRSSTTSDWQCDKSLQQCLLHLLKSDIATDVTFLLGGQREVVRAHKLLLISRSPVFYAMLEGPLSEKGEIIIPDITKMTFMAFLEYLYTDKVTLLIENVMPIMAAARKYCVDSLVMKCMEFIRWNMNTNTACYFLEIAHYYIEDGVRQECLDFIEDNAESTLQSDGFIDLCPDCVADVTHSDNLLADEEIIFETVIRWFEAQCARQGKEATDKNKRDALGKILYTIRFPLLNSSYFDSEILESNLLNPEEIVHVYRSRQRKKENIFYNDHNDIFKTTPRAYIPQTNLPQSWTWEQFAVCRPIGYLT